MNNKLKLLTFAAIAAFLGVIVWAVMSVPAEIPPEEAKKEEPKFMDYGPNTIREEQNGKLIWEVSSESSRMDMKTKETVMNKITGKYYQKDGKILTVTAPKGFYTDTTRHMKLVEGVKAVNSDGSTLTSKELEWLDKEGVLVATGDARLVRPDLEASGDRLEAREGFDVFVAIGKAHVVRKNAN